MVSADGAEVVRVRNLFKRYRKHAAVEDVSLAIRRGEIYGLIGPDGAGKSSVMKAIAGVLSFEGGSVEVLGQVIDSEAAAERVKARIGFMPQGLGLNLYPELSVEENIDFFAELREVPPDQLTERKRKLLAMTRLDQFRERPMKHLSGGMKQKLGLVCTLIHEPELIILDEPTTGVDPVSRRDFWAILTQLLREKGVTALVSTAYLDEAERFARLALISGGRVIAAGETAEIVGQAPSLEDAFISLLRQRGLIPDGELKNHDLDAKASGSRHDGIAISAQGLTRDFDHFRAVDRISFEVCQGEIFGLLGANGAGKTTVIKMLTGILPPSGGQGWVAGEDMRRASQAIKARIGYVSQAFSLYPDLTCQENLHLFGRIYGVNGGHLNERIGQVLRLAGLDNAYRKMASSLPMGIRQRLALACALIHRPQVLFLDEPTSGVDPIGRRHFWEILLHLARAEGVAILLTTHYMSEAEQCDRLALMHGGKLVACDSPAALKAQLETEAGCILDIVAEPVLAALDVLEAASFNEPTLFGRRIHLLARDAEAAETRVRELFGKGNIHLIGITRLSPGLEEVFTHRILQCERGNGS